MSGRLAGMFATEACVWRLRGILAAALFAAAVPSADSVFAEESATFEGLLLPLADPVLLRYRPTPGFTMTSQTSTDWWEYASATVMIEGRILAVGDLLEWRMNTWVVDDRDDARLQAPPFTVTAQADDIGAWTEVEVRGRHPVSGELMPGTAEYDALLALVTGRFPALPREPVGQGDELITSVSKEELEQRYAEQLGGDVWLDLSVQVIGETIQEGRKSIVGKLTGSITQRKSGAKGTVYLAGYVVHDLETGLVAKSVVQRTNQYYSEWIIVTTVTETRFR